MNLRKPEFSCTISLNIFASESSGYLNFILFVNVSIVSGVMYSKCLKSLFTEPRVIPPSSFPKSKRFNKYLSLFCNFLIEMVTQHIYVFQ